jgi:hypothetical protein
VNRRDCSLVGFGSGPIGCVQGHNGIIEVDNLEAVGEICYLKELISLGEPSRLWSANNG